MSMPWYDSATSGFRECGMCHSRFSPTHPHCPNCAMASKQIQENRDLAAKGLNLVRRLYS